MNEEITFIVEPCEVGGGYVARWDDPLGRGGITTQGDSLSELQEMVSDAVAGFFEPDEKPRRVKLHFAKDPVLQMA
jgi:predicted RNase H-like HicB family nuclease